MPLDYFIPQVHLRNFYLTDDKGRLVAVRKDDLKTFHGLTENVCRRPDGSTNLYLHEPRAIEEFLNRMEPNYNAELDPVRNRAIEVEHVYLIAGFVAYTFSALTGGSGGMRLIAPLTPGACFVTLLGTETQKRIVLYGIKADDDLARRISIVLTQAALGEFLSAPNLVPFHGEGGSLGDLLEDLTKLARGQKRDHLQSGSST